jgi:DNA-binding HxlR family transcriptional regulator
MDEQVVRHYLKKVPVEIREAVMELDTPQKWAIYIALAVDGDKYFNQLKKEFRANPNTIDKALKSLVASGLVAKKVQQLADIGDTNRTYYTTTRLGEKLLNSLCGVVLPPLAVLPAAAPATRSAQVSPSAPGRGSRVLASLPLTLGT